MTESAPVTVNFKNKELRTELTHYAKSKGHEKLRHLMVVALNEYIRRHLPKNAVTVMLDWLDGKL